MEQTPYATRLRYLDADAVDDALVNYDGLDVLGPDGEKLGDLDGFIVDAEAGRVYHVVIDTAGWFRTKQLLLPIGHATLDVERKALRIDVSKDALNRYPEFTDRQFREFTDDDLRQFESRTAEACCPDDAVQSTSASSSTGDWAYDSRRHYSEPSWWKSESYSRERLRPVEARQPSTRAVGPAAAAATAAGPRSSVTNRDERLDRDRVVARDDEATRRDAGDVSPHFGGRAQPGDVLGIETAGEVTKVGDSPEDENERRRDAERAAAKEREEG